MDNNNNNLKCNFCELQFNYKSSMNRHMKYYCHMKKQIEEKIKIEQECAKKESENTKKELEDTKRELKYTKRKLENTVNELDITKKELELLKTKMMQKMETQIEYLYDTHKNSASTLDKSMDALTFLMTHRKNAPELRKLTHKKAQELLTNEAKLYTHLLHHNEEKTLDQYIGEIILTHVKKNNPDEQSVWNSDVSRLTFLIREIVDESPTWLRDPKGAAFNEKIIVPIINVIKTYLEKCLHSTNPDKVSLDTDSENESDNESEKSESEHDKMRRTGRILDTIETLKSKTYKKSLSEYVASHIPLHKPDKIKKKNKQKSNDSTDNDTNEKPKKILKKKPINSTDSETDEKPKKAIKKSSVKHIVILPDSDTDEKPKKVTKKK